MQITLASRSDFLSALESAASVALSAYVLEPSNRVARALEAAADRGASVSVTLDGAPYFGAGSADRPNPNLETAAGLRAHGIRVRLTDPKVDPPMHLKAAVVDGRAFLDDRNWPSGGRATIVATPDPAAVRAIGSGIDGIAGGDDDLALVKSRALVLEAALIASAPGIRIDVATESFGSCVVADALCDRARAGATVRLEVDARVLAGDARGREHKTIARLEAAGVVVRAVGAAEKFTVAGDDVWLGSANATANDGAMLDWGIRSRDAVLARSLEAAFDGTWTRGSPVDTAQAPKRAAAVADVRAATSSTARSSSFARYAAVAVM